MRDAAHLIASQRDDFAPTLAARIGAAILDLVRTIRARRRARRTWIALGELDDHLLADVGLSRADIETETRRGTLAGVDARLADVVRRRREERWRS